MGKIVPLPEPSPVDIVYSLPFLSSAVRPENILLCSIVAAAALIYLPYFAVATGRFQVGYEMGAPRGMFDKLPDYAQRATWARIFSLYFNSCQVALL